VQEIKNIHEKNFVNVLRARTNESVSPIIDHFSGWLIGGFGAAAALLVSQYDSVSNHINTNVIQEFLLLLMVALVIAVIQKFISSLIIANAKASIVAVELGKAAAENNIELDFKFIFEEIEKSIFPISRWAVRRSFRKAIEGDLVASSRNFVRLFQVQGLITLAQVLVTLFAIYKLAAGFHA
jgi:hypothetical protein